MASIQKRMNRCVFLVCCTDEQGLVFRVSEVLYRHSLNIISNREFVDREHGQFFMRTEVEGSLDAQKVRGELQGLLPPDAYVRATSRQKKSFVVMATKEAHCLGDLLIRVHDGELAATIPAVISNHDHLRDLVERFEIPYICVPHENLRREEHERAVLNVLERFDFDYLVLAKYMRILSAETVERFSGRIINIHHSFLPAFVGANPYRRAHERGVKIIGATAHFVTADLDEGPIIAQDVLPVGHEYSWKDMKRAGRDVEKIVLSRALRLAIEDRVFIHQNRTIIL